MAKHSSRKKWNHAHGLRPIRNVRVVVQSKNDKMYWNGQGWHKKFTHFEAVVGQLENGGVEWRYTYPGELHEGLYFGARALDDKFDYDKTPAYFEWVTNGIEAIEYSNNALPSGSFFPDIDP